MRLIKMVSVGKSSMGWDGKPFWGLVVQKGPWKSTPLDIQRANQKDNLTVGGGIPMGGREHAGAARFKSVMTPYQIDGTNAPPEPSHYAKRSVVIGAVDMKRQGARGTVMKTKMTLGGRTPVQTGHKMGGAPEEIVLAQPSELPDLLAPTISDYYSLPELNGAFESQHHIEEWADKLNAALERSGSDSRSSIDTDNLMEIIWQGQYPKSSSSMSVDTPKDPHEALMRLAKSEGLYPKSSSSMSVDTPYQKSVMSVDAPRSGTYIEQYPQLPEFQPIAQPKLELTQDFLQSIADYQEKEAEKRKEKMERMSVDEPVIFEKPAGIETGRGKKFAMSKETLGKEADVRGLPFKKAAKFPMSKEKLGEEANVKELLKKAAKARPSAKVPKVPKVKKEPSEAPSTKTPAFTKSRVEKKKKEVKYQPVTEKNTDALLKRLGFKIKKRFENMKKDNVQYLITKAAYEKWLKKK